MGSSTKTSSSTSGPSNPALSSLLTKLSTGISSQYKPNGSLYSAPGQNTTQGWQASLNAANNSDYSGGLAGALASYGNRAAGNELGLNDPLYNAQRSRLIDDVKTNVGGVFTGSGRFGSGSHVDNLTSELTSGVGALDAAQRRESYGLQSEAANMLPQLFSGAQLPASIQQSIGASQDADAAAKLRGGIDYQSAFASLLGQAAGASPTTTTTKEPTAPLWQTLLGLGVKAL